MGIKPRTNAHRRALLSIRTATPLELFSTYRQVLTELRGRGITRTMNAPAGDWAEHLVHQAFGGELASPSQKSWDIKTEKGARLQVKARTQTAGPRRPLSFFRSFKFDELVVVLLNGENFDVERATILDVTTAKKAARYIRHVNGYRIVPTDALLDQGRDITKRLQAIANRPGPQIAPVSAEGG